MRIFSAGIGTETNTFSPLPTGLDAFLEGGYYPAGTHPSQPTRYAAPLIELRRRAPENNWTVLEGLYAGAQPSGLVTRHAYETLRNEILGDVRRALPVDVVILGLHGAMVAEGYDDCEGDLIAKVRGIVGPDVIIGCELDPHAHLSPLMVESSNLLIAYKEYPHTDIYERAVELVELCTQAHEGAILLKASVVDTNMVIPIHTSSNPGRAFIDKLSSLEGTGSILSISAIQGFATGDVPSMGTKVIVYTNNAPEEGLELASALAKELIDTKHDFRVNYLSIDEALDQAQNSEDRPVILADRADNPGSGAAGDSTFVLKRMLDRGIVDAAIGPIWDPVAVQVAFEAGEGAVLGLRIGGKISPMSGDPVDGIFRIKALRRNHIMTGQTGEPLSLGDAALLEINGIECVITTKRNQALNTDLFKGLGCELEIKKIIVVKSAQHFYASFSKLSRSILYVSAPGSATPQYDKLPYKKIKLPKWPIA